MNARKAKTLAAWGLSLAIVATVAGIVVSLYDSVLRFI